MFLAYILGALCALLFAFTMRPTYPVEAFSELATSHACVHLLDSHKHPHRPAYMILPEGSLVPIFVDLYTNNTIGTVVQYAHTASYHTIIMTSPVYGRRSLHQTLLHPPPIQQMALAPAVRKVFENRNATWWVRCDRHWRELTDQS